MRWFWFLFVFVFLCAFVSAENSSDLPTEIMMNPIVHPWIDVELGEELCNTEHLVVDGAFYLNLDAILSCPYTDYEIELRMYEKGFLWDKLLDDIPMTASCNWLEVQNDPEAMFKVPWSFSYSAYDLRRILKNYDEDYEIYFEAEVVDGPEDFEFNFNSGDFVRSEDFEFYFKDCRECVEGACCDKNFDVMEYGAQPKNKEDEFLCSGENSPDKTSYLYKVDHYCDGVHAIGYEQEVIGNWDECGECEYCIEGLDSCKNYAKYTFVEWYDCDFKDTECRDYEDVERKCDGFGGVLNFVCSYENEPDGTSCFNGECFGGECVECESRYEEKCFEGDVYWYDSCGVREERKEDCFNGCSDGECVGVVTCYEDSDCPVFDEERYCSGNTRVIKTPRSRCVNPGVGSVCRILIPYDYFLCEFGCSDGECVTPEIECSSDSDCDYDLIARPTCDEGVLYQLFNYSYCVNSGEPGSYCKRVVDWSMPKDCEFGCSNGKCSPKVEEKYNYSFSLREGWNLIAIPFEVSDFEFEEIFGECFLDVEQIKDEDKFYSKKLPSYLNTLDSLSYKKGYWVYSSGECEVFLDGLEKADDCEVSFSEGWNLISYLGFGSMGLEDYFGSNFVYVEQIKDEDKFYSKKLPSYLSSLKKLEFGKGYWVFAERDFDLVSDFC